jgi:hypothetical protein
MLVGRAVSHMGWRQRNNQLAHKQVPWRKRGSCLAVKRSVAADAWLDIMEGFSYFAQRAKVDMRKAARSTIG